MPAVMVTRCFHKRIGNLHLADTQILSISDAGAQQFGLTPKEAVGRFMSDLQDADWREAGHQRYLDRKLGRTLSKDYVVMVRRPDGEQVGQRREFGGFMEGVYGEEIYLTYLYPARELDHGPTIRTLNSEEKRVARVYNGDCTVADLRQRLATKTLPVAMRESFPHTIKQCADLSSGVFAGKYPTPLDLFLSDDVAVCYREKTQDYLVRPRFCCEFCGWQWYGRATHKAECTGCGKHFRRYDTA